jgi:protein phosphatase
MMKVKHHAYISGQGKRQNNEDNFGIYGQTTFVVCDGVGGAEKGEIASDLVAKTFIHALKENPEQTASEIIGTAEKQLSDYMALHPESVGMATTLTLAHVRPNGMYVAWCGDSRIYQFRKGTIVFKSVDHSWVNEALAAGILTPEEAINHPKKNIITRAIQGKHKPTEVQDFFMDNIQQGDCFLLCSDGVLESWNDEDLQALFHEDFTPEKHLELIQQECEQHSKDNFTAIVLQIAEGVTPTEQYVVNVPEQTQRNSASATPTKRDIPAAKKSPFIPSFNAVALVLFLLLAAAAFYLGRNWAEKESAPKEKVLSKDKNSKAQENEKESTTLERTDREKVEKIKKSSGNNNSIKGNGSPTNPSGSRNGTVTNKEH